MCVERSWEDVCGCGSIRLASSSVRSIGAEVAVGVAFWCALWCWAAEGNLRNAS